MYDVIVLGAGPTGCTAAHELVSNGYKVLLVERNSLPRNKSCSGILINRTMNLVQRFFGEPVPDYTCCTPYDNRGMVLFTDTGEELRFEQPGKNVWRSDFDYWLAQKAVTAGAQLRTETAALGYEETAEGVSVRLKAAGTGSREYSETTKMVIVCTGAGSGLRLTGRRTVNPVFTYQTFCNGTIDLDPHYFYAFLQPRFSRYDAWFNVKDDYLIFGVASQDARTLPGYYKQFRRYMETTYRAQTTFHHEEQWLMPHVAPGCPLVLGQSRILVAGEAAGFLNPMGEGISDGMESGYHAARAIIGTNREHYSSEQDYEAIQVAYRKATEELHRYMRRQWNFIGHTSSTFSHMKDSGSLL